VQASGRTSDDVAKVTAILNPNGGPCIVIDDVTFTYSP
jgi:hypothetical protein